MLCSESVVGRYSFSKDIWTFYLKAYAIVLNIYKRSCRESYVRAP